MIDLARMESDANARISAYINRAAARHLYEMRENRQGTLTRIYVATPIDEHAEVVTAHDVDSGMLRQLLEATG